MSSEHAETNDSSEAEMPRLVHSRGFLQGARDQGVKTHEAVLELVDNSLDANAENVWVNVEEVGDEDPDAVLRITVEDDGNGIPRTLVDEFGDEWNGLGFALSYGYKKDEPGTRIGKFGWGLSMSSVCQSLRTSVWSKRADENGYRMSYLDIEELTETNQLTPPTPEVNRTLDSCPGPIESPEKESGTIVVLERIDDPDWQRANTAVRHLIKRISRVYRRYLSKGRSIYVNGTELDQTDPLFRTDGCWKEDKVDHFDLFPKSSSVKVDIPERWRKPGGPKTDMVRIDIAFLDPQKADELGMDQKVYAEEVNIKHKNQGFSLMRNDREIANGLTLGLYERHPVLNYMRGEISFPDTLDKFFGIQNNKSRYTLKNSVRDKLKAEVTPIQRDIKRAREGLKGDQTEKENKKDMISGEQSRSEHTGANTEQHWSDRPGGDDKENRDVQVTLSNPIGDDTDKNEDDDESSVDELEPPSEEDEESTGWEYSDSLFNISYDSDLSGLLFDWSLGPKRNLHIKYNDLHPFFKRYIRMEDEEVRALIDYLVMSMTWMDSQTKSRMEREQNRRFIEDFSSLLRDLVEKDGYLHAGDNSSLISRDFATDGGDEPDEDDAS